MSDEYAQRSAPLVEFTDKDGGKYWLSPKALHHIKHDNCIDDPVGFIENVFRNTIAVVESRWKPAARLYYASLGKLLSVVVANIDDRRIKTAFISDQIKSTFQNHRVMACQQTSAQPN